MGRVGAGLGWYVGNIQVLRGMLEQVWGCMLATCRSDGACWNGFGAVCWQPTTGLMGMLERGWGLYVGNLQEIYQYLSRRLLGRSRYQEIPVVPHKAAAEVSKIGNL